MTTGVVEPTACLNQPNTSPAGKLATWRPIRLYLIFSLVYVATASLVALPPQITGDDRRGAVISSNGVRISGESLFAGRSKEEMAERFQHAPHDWMPRLMFVLLPVSALLVGMTNRRSGRNLPQHLYFVLHLHAATFGIMAAAALAGYFLDDRGQAVITGLLLAWIAWYLVTGLHTADGGSWRGALLRGAVAGVSYFTILIIATTALFVVALLV